MLTAHQIEKYLKKLHAMRAELDARASALRDEASHGVGDENAGDLSHVPIHLGDLGSQEADIAVSIGLAECEAATRQEVDGALMRLDAGKFGVCEECGQPIGTERLEAIPYSRWCIRCAEQSQR